MAEGSPVVPIVLVKGILDGYNGVLGNHLLVEGNELVTSKKFGRILIRSRGLEVKVVLILILDLELRRGDIKANRNLVSIPSLLGSLHAHVNAGLDIAGRGEATLVTDEGGVTTELALDDLFEVVEDLAANFHGLAVQIHRTSQKKTKRAHEIVWQAEVNLFIRRGANNGAIITITNPHFQNQQSGGLSRHQVPSSQNGLSTDILRH
mmetsp:Transcript_48246/g.145819  ORF Transcript_48246/g.145819 Transcript_48246/m.145819 type:complete len:207 (+) Transcript_48246:949-1569(+)